MLRDHFHECTSDFTPSRQVIDCNKDRPKNRTSLRAELSATSPDSAWVFRLLGAFERQGCWSKWGRAPLAFSLSQNPQMPNRGHRDWYQLERWRRLAKRQLREHPLCALCLARGRVEPARIAD